MSVDFDYDAMFEDDSDVDDIMITGATYYKNKQNITTAAHLSKTWKISHEDSHRTIENATQRHVRKTDRSLKKRLYYK